MDVNIRLINCKNSFELIPHILITAVRSEEAGTVSIWIGWGTLDLVADFEWGQTEQEQAQ